MLESNELARLLVEGVIACCVVYLLLFKKSKAQPVPPIPTSTPHWLAIIAEELSKLQGPTHLEKPKETMGKFAALVDDFIRHKFLLEATPLTTTEIAKAIQEKCTPNEMKEIIFLLQGSDLVKYTNQDPREDEWEKLFACFRTVIAKEMQTHEFIR